MTSADRVGWWSSAMGWPAGASSRRSLRLRSDRRFSITIIGDEPGGAYNRMLLSNVLAGVTTRTTYCWPESSGMRPWG